MSPSPLPGGFGSDAQRRPYRFAIMPVKATSGAHAGTVVAKVKPNAEALFSVNLPPGDYVLQPLPPTNGGCGELQRESRCTPGSAHAQWSSSKARSASRPLVGGVGDVVHQKPESDSRW